MFCFGSGGHCFYVALRSSILVLVLHQFIFFKKPFANVNPRQVSVHPSYSIPNVVYYYFSLKRHQMRYNILQYFRRHQPNLLFFSFPTVCRSQDSFSKFYWRTYWENGNRASLALCRSHQGWHRMLFLLY